jgi:hypothetical protein
MLFICANLNIKKKVSASSSSTLFLNIFILSFVTLTGALAATWEFHLSPFLGGKQQRIEVSLSPSRFLQKDLPILFCSKLFIALILISRAFSVMQVFILTKVIFSRMVMT